MPERKKKSWFAIAEHPLATLVALLTCIALVGAGFGWVGATFVFRTDYVRDKDWHEVGHQNLRVERLGDEVDKLTNRQRYRALTREENVDLQLWQKKLDAAATQLVQAKAEAIKASR